MLGHIQCECGWVGDWALLRAYIRHAMALLHLALP